MTSVQADTSIADIQKKGEIVVGVKQDVPNFGYKNPKTGEFSGIETDLAKLIADQLKVKVRYVPVTAQNSWSSVRQRTSGYGYRHLHYHR